MSARRGLWAWWFGEEPEEKGWRQSVPQEGSSHQRDAGLRAGTQPASAWDIKAVEVHGRGLGRGELCLAPPSFLLMKGVPCAP